MTQAQVVLIVFIITYLFIALQRIPGLRIDRPSGVTIGSIHSFPHDALPISEK